MRFLAKHGMKVRDLWLRGSEFHGMSDSKSRGLTGGMVGLLALVPHLDRLNFKCGRGFFAPRHNMYILRHLPALRSLQLYVEASRGWPLDTLEPLTWLPGLEKLELSVNRMTHIPLLLPPEFSRLTTLSCLSLTRDLHYQEWDAACDVPNLAQAISHLTGLRSLELQGVADVVPAVLSRLQHLSYLQLGGFQSHWPPLVLPAALRHCVSLRHIFFNRCVSDASYDEWLSICQSLQAIPSLRTLHLANMDFSEVPTDAWVFPFGLTDLHLYGCGLRAMPEAISGLTSLRSLQAAGNRITGLIPGPYLQRLTYLDLSGNPLAAMPQLLEAATALQNLDLGYKADEEPWLQPQPILDLLPAGCHLTIHQADDDDWRHWE